MVEAVLAARAGVNAKNQRSWTALKIAQLSGHTRMVKLLSQAGSKE